MDGFDRRGKFWTIKIVDSLQKGGLFKNLIKYRR